VIRDLDAATTLSGYLIFPNGTRYRIDNSDVSWIRDRNGNLTTFTYEGGWLVKVTDSIGREVTFAYNIQDSGQYGLHDQIIYKGFGEQTRTIRISYKSLAEILRSDYTIQTYNALFGLEDMGSTQHNPANHVSAVWLPNGQSYRFYYNSYSELARVELPTGGAFEYDWGASLLGGASNGIAMIETPDSPSGEFPEIYRRVLTKRIYPNGGTGNTFSVKTTFSQTSGQGTTTSSATIEQRDVSNNLLGQTKHYFYGNPIPLESNDVFFTPVWNEGKEYQTEVFDIVSNLPVLKQRVNQNWQPRVNNFDPRVIETTTTLIDTNQVTKTSAINPYNGSIGFDQFNNQTDVWEYDYGNGVPSQYPIRHSHTDFLTTNNGIDYTATGVHIRNLPIRQWVKGYDANGQELPNYASYSEILYDEAVYPLLTYSTVTGWTDPATSARGNVTTTRAWLNTNNSYLESHIQYDQLGNVRKAWDAKGNLSEIEYWSYNNTYAFPILTRTPIPDPTGTKGSNTAFISTKTFDFSSGLVLTSTDANGNMTTVEYNDVLDRPTKVTNALGGWTSYEYGDAIGNLYLKTTSTLTASQTITSYRYFDGLGRSVRGFTQDNGGWIAADTQYDALGRVSRVSNPYRVNSLTDPVNPSNLWTTSSFDSLGRVVEVKTPDNAIVTSAYSGNTTTVTDQAGKKRRSVMDALGRLMRVDEPKADTGELDVNGVPYQSTNYGYDVLGNLLTVNQGVQTRTFVYDSLSRLQSATNPELGTTSTNGTITYSYDSNGNLLTKTDARNITTTFSYDALNRVVLRDYSDSTPDVSYFYDGTGLSQVPANSKGALTKVSSSVSETRYTSFDTLGRLKSNEQVIDGITYPMSYSYNLGGALVSQTYPSGRVVTNTFDNDGQLSNVSSKANLTATPRTYANSFIYTTHGAVSSMRLGNGRFESTVFNSRLQPTQIALGTSANNTSLLKLDYTYGVKVNGVLDTTKNNGNAESQTITVPGMSNPFVQTYTYDSLNRLLSATEMTGSTQSWKQTFTFDRYGNRRFDMMNTTVPDSQSNQNITNPQIDPSNNRFSANQGYDYDQSGNVTKDATDKRFAYDAENKQTSFGTNGSSTNGGSYFYDGDGRRVKKVVGTETTIFVYNASGQMVAEYSTTTPTNPTISYLTTDTLGTPRINTDANGSVKARHDYLPFGEEIIGLGNRQSSNGYQADDIRQKFTQYERDDETGLDYAQARYYSSQHGRFMSVDPFGGSGFVSIPQSWNRYAYCLNRPFVFTDPSGMIWLTTDNQTFIWVDDKEYEKNGGKYKNYSPANGAVIELVSSTNCPSCRGKEGSWIQLNADGTVSAVPDPTTYVDYEYSDEEINSVFNALLGSVRDSADKPDGGPRGGSRRFNRGKDGYTVRWYDEDGKAWVDIDYGHDHGAGDPHVHWWDWTGQLGNRLPGEPVPEGWDVDTWDDGSLEYNPTRRRPFNDPYGFTPVPARPMPIRPGSVRPTVPLRPVMSLRPILVP
jgi:RHS repeat-associated protein